MLVIGDYNPLVILSVCSVNTGYRSCAVNMQENSLGKLSLTTPPLPTQSEAHRPIASLPTELSDDCNAIFQIQLDIKWQTPK
jgi:hypothetical protein